MSPEAAGDYAAGPNHVLPTSGAARLRGGLSAADFVKVIATQSLDIKALKRLAPAITTLARAEGLESGFFGSEPRSIVDCWICTVGTVCNFCFRIYSIQKARAEACPGNAC